MKRERERPRRRRGRRSREERGGEEERQAKRNAERARTLAQDGQYTKACQALNSAGMAPDSEATRAALQAKHPPADAAPAPAPPTQHPQLTFTMKEVEKAARRFRKGSAPGPSGWRPW